MSVLLNTSAGDLVVDLFTDSCPIATKNFLKLCQIKYYNNCLFYNVQQNFIAQTGDPTGTGKGGTSIYGIQNGDPAGYFQDEIVKGKKINRVGMVGMAHSGGKEGTNRSQFFITLRGEDMDQFENTHTIFGEIAEGLEVLEKINALYCDEDGRPYQDVRILHTYILDDPFPDPAGLVVPPSSPERTFPEQERVKRRLAYSETIVDDADGKTAEELDQSIRRKEAKSRAIVLEMTGDIPDADVKPPEEVLFVCKLNPVTTDEDLELIFSRFGTIKSCEVIRDFKTGDSLNYAFIEFETAGTCIEAYEKMNNVLIDDRRIKVDFSQSVSKLWNRFLLQPRKGDAAGGDKSAPKPGEKPSYYMRQPGMNFSSAPAAGATPAAASVPVAGKEVHNGNRHGAPQQPAAGERPRREDSRERDRSKRSEPAVEERRRDERRRESSRDRRGSADEARDHHREQRERQGTNRDRGDRGDREEARGHHREHRERQGADRDRGDRDDRRREEGHGDRRDRDRRDVRDGDRERDRKRDRSPQSPGRERSFHKSRKD